MAEKAWAIPEKTEAGGRFRFVDLFCGVGGFHQAATSLGGHCVFASEIDDDCARVYERNFGMRPAGDIFSVNAKDVPKHDVLCAGFPCQAFSKAGKQLGVKDARGILFFEIVRILKVRKPPYILLENVRNLVSHAGGNTWAAIQRELKGLGYRLTGRPLILSPHQFGVPQLRERVFILGKREPKRVDEPLTIDLPKPVAKADNDAYAVLDANVPTKYAVSAYERRVLDAWDEFYAGVGVKTIGFPVWADCFKVAPDPAAPALKQEFMQKNRELYLSNKRFVNCWLKKHKNLEGFKPTHRKFEWQAGGALKSLWEGIIQFRPSGIRVKRPDAFPALVAMAQIPVVGRLKRRITPRECARLQSFSESFKLDENDLNAYKQLGNSVSVKIVRELLVRLLKA